MRIAIVLFTTTVLLAAAPAWAIDQAMIDGYAAASRAERAAELLKARQWLEHLRRDRKLSKEDREKYLRSTEQKLTALEDPMRPYFGAGNLSLTSAAVGQVGRHARLDGAMDGSGSYGLGVRVFQVVDAKNALVEYVMFTDGPKVRSSKTAFGVPAYTVESSKMFWLAGVETSGMVDGRRIELDGVFAVTGNRTYDAEEGTNTVFVLERVDLAEHKDKFTRLGEARTWTSLGGHTTEAIFVRYKGGKVTLMRPDGRSADVPLAKLSEADRQFVRDWITATKSQ